MTKKPIETQPSKAPIKIAVNNVSKAFGRKQVLKNISLEVRQGESLVVIGGSGTGKSVLLKSILGLLQPDEGEILVNDKSMLGLSASEHEKRMLEFGMLFQGGALFDSLTVWENITFAMRQQQKMTKQEALDLAIEKLHAVGLSSEVAIQQPSELSGGMQKRVALARAIAGDPDIIFFDEPTTGLDPIMADVINDLIVKCTRDLGLTTVTITHDMVSAKKIATNVAMLYEGKIIWEGPAGAIMKSGNAYVDQFVHGRADGPIEVDSRNSK